MSEAIPEELFDFIERHRTDDPNSLRLKFRSTSNMPWISTAINHIEALKKSEKKLGELQPELMATPLSVEQASSAPVARLHGSIAKTLVPQARSFLDMTCGLGIDFRAIAESLGKECRSTAVELKPELASAARYNFRNSSNMTIIQGDSIAFLESPYTTNFDLIFIDPARRDSNGGRVYNIHDCQPDISCLIPVFQKKASFVMIKLSPMLDVARTLADLPCSALYVIDDGKECREILAILKISGESDTSHDADTIPIIIHSGDNLEPLIFTRQEEYTSTALYTETPITGQWLFEPSPATMKAAPFSLLSKRYGIKKLHPNTHLYVADTPLYGHLPGKWHRIIEVIPFSSSNLKHLARKKIKADVAVRNFPLKAEELARRLNVVSGNDLRIVGATCGNNAHILMLLEK